MWWYPGSLCNQNSELQYKFVCAQDSNGRDCIPSNLKSFQVGAHKTQSGTKWRKNFKWVRMNLKESTQTISGFTHTMAFCTNSKYEFPNSKWNIYPEIFVQLRKKGSKPKYVWLFYRFVWQLTRHEMAENDRVSDKRHQSPAVIACFPELSRVELPVLFLKWTQNSHWQNSRTCVTKSLSSAQSCKNHANSRCT